MEEIDKYYFEEAEIIGQPVLQIPWGTISDMLPPLIEAGTCLFMLNALEWWNYIVFFSAKASTKTSLNPHES